MWYVIQTLGGQEEKTADMIKKQISSDFIEECFVPKRERMKKFYGSWNKVEEVLFQGYVFASSEKPEELYQELRKIPKLTKMIGREKGYFYSLTMEEEMLVRGIGDQNHKTGLSKIQIVEGEKIRVIQGPLGGYVGDVVKVNAHKREVVIKVNFMGKPVKLFMGIEMVEN